MTIYTTATKPVEVITKNATPCLRFKVYYCPRTA